MATDLTQTNPEMLGLDRQRAMAQALIKRGMETPQGQMIGNRYVGASPLQFLGNLFQQYTGQKLGEEADTKQVAYANALRDKQQQAATDYVSAMQGQNVDMPQQQGPMPTGGNIPVQTVNTGPDYAKALKAAISPNASSALQTIGYDLLKPVSIKKDETLFARNLTPGGGMTTIAEGVQSMPTGMESAQIALGLPRNSATWTKEQRQAASNYDLRKTELSANRSFVNVQNQLPFKEQIQKEAASGLMKNFETLQNVPAALANMDKMVALSKQPIYAGVGGETKLQIAKLFNNNFGTNISPDKVQNTEEFKSAAYMGIMDNLKKTDSNPTMAQQNALKEAIGSLGTDPAAIPRVVNVMRDVLVNKATQHNELVRQTIQKGVDYPYNIEVQLPKTPPPSSGNVRSLADEILNRK